MDSICVPLHPDGVSPIEELLLDHKHRDCKIDCTLLLDFVTDDVLSKILSFLKFMEATGTIDILAQTAAPKRCLRSLAVWRQIFERRGFALRHTFDYREEYRSRSRLLARLFEASCLQPRLLPRELLCGSVDDLRRNRQRRIASIFEFQLVSAAIAPGLLVLDRDNQGLTRVAFQVDVALTDEESLEICVSEINGDTTTPTMQVLYESRLVEDQDESTVFDNKARLLRSKPSFSGNSAATVGLVLEVRNDADGEIYTEFRFWHQSSTSTIRSTRCCGNMALRNVGTSHPKTFSACGFCRVQGTCSSLVDFCTSDYRQRKLIFVARSDGSGNDATTLIEVYRMEFFPSEEGGNVSRSWKCHQPEFDLDCRETILSFSVSPTGGEILVATSTNLQIWTMATSHAKLTTTIPFYRLIEKLFEGLRDSSFLHTFLGLARHRPQPHSEVSIHVPRHLAFETCGFVTMHINRLQYSSIGRHTALFWEKRKEYESLENGCWGISVMINLPLLPYHIPQVHFDGSRFIAFGQDFIGFIILVYQVHSSEDSDINVPEQVVQSQESPSRGQEESGGVYNFDSSLKAPRVKFAKRIRHGTLGGIDRSQQLQMTCNERFLVIRTKKGDRLRAGAHTQELHPSDCLLVFDLDDSTSATDSTEDTEKLNKIL